jgi:hypothetical protein
MNRSHGRSPAGALLHACSLFATALPPSPSPSIALFPVVRPYVALKYYRLSIRLPESSPAGCREHISRPSASSRRLRPRPTPALARPARVCAGTAETTFKIELLPLQVRRTVHLAQRQLLASPHPHRSSRSCSWRALGGAFVMMYGLSTGTDSNPRRPQTPCLCQHRSPDPRLPPVLPTPCARWSCGAASPRRTSRS